jgi:tetratricopeptide (TPR) repeat protein
VGITHCVVFGTREAVEQLLAKWDWKISPAFVERLDLVLHQHVATIGDRSTHGVDRCIEIKFSVLYRFASLGEFWLARGEMVQAQACANQCLDMAMRTQARKYLVRGGRLQGEIALARYQQDDAAAWLQQALAQGQALGNPPQLWKTYTALGRLQTVLGQPVRAQQAYDAALQVLEQVKAHVQSPTLCVSLEHSTLIQRAFYKTL